MFFKIEKSKKLIRIKGFSPSNPRQIEDLAEAIIWVPVKSELVNCQPDFDPPNVIFRRNPSRKTHFSSKPSLENTMLRPENAKIMKKSAPARQYHMENAKIMKKEERGHAPSKSELFDEKYVFGGQQRAYT